MSANPALATALRSILDRDAASIQQLTKLLVDERDALKTRDTQRLNDLVTRKMECLRTMEQIDRERKTLVKRSRVADWPTLVETVDHDGRLGLTAAWRELLRQLREAAELTEVNSRIVSRTRQSTERLLALMRGQSESVGIYDRLGRTRGYADNRPVIRA